MPKMLIFKFVLLFVLLAAVIYLQTSLSPSEDGHTGGGVLSLFNDEAKSH